MPVQSSREENRSRDQGIFFFFLLLMPKTCGFSRKDTSGAQCGLLTRKPSGKSVKERVEGNSDRVELMSKADETEWPNNYVLNSNRTMDNSIMGFCTIVHK